MNRFSKLLSRTIEVLLGIALFLPLVMQSRFFFPFIVPRYLAFQVVVEVAFAAYLILVSIDRRYRPRWDWVLLCYLGFVAASLLATVTGISLVRSIFGNYERMAGLIHIFHLALYLFVLIQALRDREAWHRLFTLAIVASSVMAVIAWLQYFNAGIVLASSGDSRLAGTVGNASFLAAYLIFPLFSLLYYLIRPVDFKLKVFALSFAILDAYLILSSVLWKFSPEAQWGVLNFFRLPILVEAWSAPVAFWPFLVFQAVILGAWVLRRELDAIRALLAILFLFHVFIFFNTQTRGALIGFIAGLAIVAALTLIRKAEKVWRMVSIGLLVGIGISGLAVIFAPTDSFVSGHPTLARLASISFNDTTTQSRLLTWAASWKGWVSSPKTFLIGLGPENYYSAFNANFPASVYKDNGSQIWFDRAHNIIFDLGLTTGLLGLALFGAMIGFAITHAWREYSRDKSVATLLFIGLVVAYVIQNLFVFDTINTEVVLFLFLGYCAYLGLQNRTERVVIQSVSLPQRKALYPVYFVIILILLLSSLYTNVRPTFAANRQLYRAVAAPIDADAVVLTQRLEDFKESIDRSPTGRFEARQQLAIFTTQLLMMEGVSADVLTQYVNAALNELEKSVTEEPGNVFHYLVLAGTLNSLSAADLEFARRALGIVDEGLPLSPTRPQLYFERGRANFALGNHEQAVADYQKGVALNPQVIESHLQLLRLHLSLDNAEGVKETMDTIRQIRNNKMSLLTYRTLVSLFSQAGEFNQVADLFRELIEREPGNGRYYLGLAEALARTGDRRSAFDALDRAVELSPIISLAAQDLRTAIENGLLNNSSPN